MSELFTRLEPPAAGRDRLRRGLQRRARRRRRTRSLVTTTITLAVVLTTWLSRPSDPAVAVPAASFEPSAHPAIAVWSGAPPTGAELRGGPGRLRPVATEADDVVLYLLDPADGADRLSSPP